MRAQRSVNDTIAWLRAGDDPNAIAGAAFLVSADLALTCAHVVRDYLALGRPTPRQLPTGTIRLSFQGLRIDVEARVAPSGWWPGGSDDDVEDVAVLELLMPLTEIRLPALAVFPPSEAFECEIYGTTGGYETIGQTVYAQRAAKPSWRGWHQIDARAGRESSYFVRQGFSGAPVLDALGNTIWGMVATVETEPGKLVAFAIAPEHLKIATDTVLQAARARQDRVEPPKAPGPLDQLAREALAIMLGEDIDAEHPSLERVDELRSALRDLAERGRKPADAGSIAEALERLKGGESSDAEAVFAGIIQQKRGEGRAAYREAAEAARHLGAIAYVNDTAKALQAYQTATELDPDDSWSWVYLGRLYQQAGDLAAAEQAFDEARAVAERAGDERDVMVADNSLGDVRVATGDLPGALAAYEAALATAQVLTAQDPGNAGWQRDLSVAHNKIGNVQSAQGNLGQALESYRASLALAERLAAADPGNAGWQRDLSVAQEKIGDVLSAQGNLGQALESYRASLALAERLAAADPGNAGWQRDLSVSQEKIGDVQSAQGNLGQALESYRASLALAERLAAADPGNAGWQRDLSVSHNKIGDVQSAQGNLGQALESYRASLAIRERLAAADPGNAGWQRDLSVSHNKIGDVLSARGSLGQALASYRATLAIRERLAAADPGNAGWQFDLGISNERIGDVLMAQGKLADALSAYERKHQAIAALVNQDPGNAGWQRDLSVSQEKIGDVLRAQGSLGQALESYRASLALAERLAAADPGNAGWQRDLALSHGRVALIDALQDQREPALAALRKGRAIIARLRQASPDHAILASDLARFDAEIAKLSG